MGLCCSKKKPPAGAAKKPDKIAADDKGKKTAPQQPKRAAKAAGDPADAGKQAAVFVVRTKDAAAPGGELEKKKKRPGSHEPAAEKPLPVVVLPPSAPVRTSSCTKEEVDAILIQCGRLSRSSSGTGRAASSETGGGHRRRRSDSKRSYDFDHDARPAGADEDWERQGAVSRPSPHRGSPQRKRSGSRERSGGSGSRRASRSPGRRTDGAATAGSGGGERARQQQQPGKMVSVPAREKVPAAAASGKRCASPRSSSPARMVMVVGNENAGCGLVTGPTPALSRSSSRKAEQSPYRRNPMAELDENALRANSNHNAKPQKKSTENAIAATPKKKATERGKETTVAPSCRSGMEKAEITEEDATVAAASETRAPSSKTSAARTASIVAESLQSQKQPVCRSRWASRDFDQNPTGSYTTTQLIEDIHSYHHQSSTSIAVPATPATPSFSLPACVAKACSIVEAVADLNSTSSENRTNEHDPGFSADDKGSVNAGSVEPRAARKHVQPAREFRVVETEEPQESAGSNSVSGNPWTPSWEPTSVESTDRTWSTAGDEVVEQSGGSHGARCSSPMKIRPRQSKQRSSSQFELSGRSRAGSGNGSSSTLHRGRSAHRGSSSGGVASGRSGVRVVSAAS